jgi:sugar phosphate isomerase/epimerase
VSLRVYQSLWGMEGLPYGRSEPWDSAERLRRIASAGFDGIGIFLSDSAADVGTIEAAGDLGLEVEACLILDDPGALTGAIELLTGLPPVRHLTVQPNLRTSELRPAVEFLRACQERGVAAPFPIYFETHRGRLTEAIGFTCLLLDQLSDLRLTADLSHYVVGTELRPDEPAGQVGAMIDRIIRASGAFHVRVASREQIQVQVEFDHHAVWFDLFAAWWTQAISAFRRSPDAAGALTFTVELGPPSWYAMTDRSGEEISDRWAEAQLIAERLRSCWENASASVPSVKQPIV